MTVQQIIHTIASLHRSTLLAVLSLCSCLVVLSGCRDLVLAELMISGSLGPVFAMLSGDMLNLLSRCAFPTDLPSKNKSLHNLAHY